MSAIYRKLTAVLDKKVPEKFQPMWNHPAGPKTIFFWAPLFKWGLVIAGLGDINRPSQTLSISQASSLALTGLIWSRYALVITPKNYSLFAVNVVVFGIQMYQLARALNYQQSLKNATPPPK